MGSVLIVGVGFSESRSITVFGAILMFISGNVVDSSVIIPFDYVILTILIGQEVRENVSNG